jgi:hypothetical protein
VRHARAAWIAPSRCARVGVRRAVVACGGEQLREQERQHGVARPLRMHAAPALGAQGEGEQSGGLPGQAARACHTRRIDAGDVSDRHTPPATLQRCRPDSRTSALAPPDPRLAFLGP